MNFNHMAMMRRNDTLPSRTRKLLKTGYVSMGDRHMAAKRRTIPGERVVSQRGSRILSTLKKAVSSDLGKDILAASVSSVGQNADNGYIKSFGKSFDESIKQKRKSHYGNTQPDLTIVNTGNTPVPQNTGPVAKPSGMSDRQYLRMLRQSGSGIRKRRRKNQRGGIHPGLLLAIPAGLAALSSLMKK